MSNYTVHISNLCITTSKNAVFNIFSKFGIVENIKIRTNKTSGSSLGYGYIEYSSYSSAKDSTIMNGVLINGNKVSVWFPEKNNISIEIITTPNELLIETGFGLIASCNDVLTSLKMNYKDVKLTVCSNKNDLAKVILRKPELVVLAVKYILLDDNSKLWLSEYFEEKNIKYTGSNRAALNFDSNKCAAKDKVRAFGIKTADYFTVLPKDGIAGSLLPLPYPLFLKPTDAANGNGVDEYSLVKNFSSFEKKVCSLHRIYQQPILVEQYLSGREYTVAIIELSQKSKIITGAVEITPPIGENKIRTLTSKIKAGNRETLKEICDLRIYNDVTELAINSFKALGIKGFCRIDIKLNKDGICNFLEANLVPGMTRRSSYFPQALKIDGKLNYQQIMNLIIESAF